MTLCRRIDRLEARHGSGGEMPRVMRIIFAAARPEGGEIVSDAVSAMVQVLDGWETIERDDGESEAAFLERIDALT
jgi:hypothetical protein